MTSKHSGRKRIEKKVTSELRRRLPYIYIGDRIRIMQRNKTETKTKHEATKIEA